MSDADKIVSNLEHLPDDIADALEKAVLRGAKKIQSGAKLLAPVGDTGYLRNSITAAVERDAELDIVGTVGTNLEYAMYVEFGTGPRGEASSKILPDDFNPAYRQTPWTYFSDEYGFVHTEGQPARPFLYPAFKQNQADVKKAIEDAIRTAMRKGED